MIAHSSQWVAVDGCGRAGAAGGGRARGGGVGRGPSEAAPPAPWIGLCCLDLGGFRQINALLGFAAGDRFLAAAAERLRAVAESGGHRLARTGGDEFAVLVADSAGAGAAG